MSREIRAYDVVVVGGGPAGSTFATLLAQRSDLSVAVFEKERFPREHIGESFSHRVMPVLAESGALEKVLASDCWIKKHGGVYAWDPARPAVALFEHGAWEEDGMLRWAMHVDRPRFDAVLLDHCRSSGVQVQEGRAVRSVHRGDTFHRVLLDDGHEVLARWIIEASGRQTSLVSRHAKSFLSQYRNVAVWSHFTGGRPAQSMPLDFGLFRERDLSPIGCYAFEGGWIWYIPVPRVVNGRRVQTHSIGIVTDPRELKRPGHDYRRTDHFLRCIRETPLLSGLVGNVEPASRPCSVATNYSMISERIADLEDRWILLGDSAYFVDPLFSSGVSHALNQASTAARLLTSVEAVGDTSEPAADLFREYDEGWRRIAHSFALAIDQWYFAISRAYPNSLYWGSRSTAPSAELTADTLHPLVDTLLGPDLLEVLTHGSRRLDDLGTGPWRKVCGVLRSAEPADGAVVRLGADVDVRDSIMIGIGVTERPTAAFWEDPARGRGADDGSPSTRPCALFVRRSVDVPAVRTAERAAARALLERLHCGPVAYGDLRSAAAPDSDLVRSLWRGGFLEVAA